MNAKIKETYEKLWPWFAITIGSVLAAGGYVVFILPMNMVEGGVTGLGIIARHITGLPIVGTTSLIITAFVFVMASRKMGKGFGLRSIYATILMNILIDVFLLLEIKKVTDDIMLASFYGGAIVGLGLGIIYHAGASTGGADALAQMVRKLHKIPVGRTLIVIDIIVLGAATLIFIPFEQIMYSLIFIYVEVKVIDMVLNGVQANQRVMVVTDKPEEMKAAIFDSLNRGITIFEATGGYTGQRRFWLSSVLPKKDVPKVRRIVAHVDEKSFVVIQDIHQVYGAGFEALPTSYTKQKKTEDQDIEPEVTQEEK